MAIRSLWNEKASLRKLVLTGINSPNFNICFTLTMEITFSCNLRKVPKFGQSAILRVAISSGVTTFGGRTSSLGKKLLGVSLRRLNPQPYRCNHCTEPLNLVTLIDPPSLLWPNCSHFWPFVSVLLLSSCLDLPTFLHLTVAGRKAITAKKPSNEPAPGPTENT